jgi:hypothetical protein
VPPDAGENIADRERALYRKVCYAEYRYDAGPIQHVAGAQAQTKLDLLARSLSSLTEYVDVFVGAQGTHLIVIAEVTPGSDTDYGFVLESPNWAADRIHALQARGFVRRNNPRRRS